MDGHSKPPAASTALILAKDAETSTAFLRVKPSARPVHPAAATVRLSNPKPGLTDAEMKVLQTFPKGDPYVPKFDLSLVREYLRVVKIAFKLDPGLINPSHLESITLFLSQQNTDEHSALSLDLLQSPICCLVAPSILILLYSAAKVNKRLEKVFTDPITHQLFPDAYLTNIAVKLKDTDAFKVWHNAMLNQILKIQMGVLKDYRYRLSQLEKEEKERKYKALLKKSDEEAAAEVAKKAAATAAARVILDGDDKDYKSPVIAPKKEKEPAPTETIADKKLKKEIVKFYERFCKEKEKKPTDYKAAESIFKTFLPYETRDANVTEIGRLDNKKLADFNAQLKKCYPHFPLHKAEWDILVRRDSTNAKAYVDAAINAREYLISETIPDDPKKTQIIDHHLLKTAALTDVQAAKAILSTNLVDDPLKAKDVIEIYKKHIFDTDFFEYCKQPNIHKFHLNALLPNLILKVENARELLDHPLFRFAPLFNIHLELFNQFHPNYQTKAATEETEEIDHEVKLLIRKNINPWTKLGVNQNADEKIIREAFRKFSRVWHPQNNPADKGEQQNLGAAAQKVLLDPVLKEQFLKQRAKKPLEEKNDGVQLLSYQAMANGYRDRIKAYFTEEGIQDQKDFSKNESFSDLQKQERELRVNIRDELIGFINCYLYQSSLSQAFKDALGPPRGTTPPLEDIQKIKNRILIEIKNILFEALESNDLSKLKDIAYTIGQLLRPQGNHLNKFKFFKLKQEFISELSEMLGTAKEKLKELENREHLKYFIDCYKGSLPSHQKFKQGLDEKDPRPSAEVQKAVITELKTKVLNDFPRISAADIKEAISNIKLNCLSRLLYSNPDYIVELDNILKDTEKVYGWDKPIDPLKNISLINRLIKVLFTNPTLDKNFLLPNHSKLLGLKNSFPKLCRVKKETLEQALVEKDGLLFLHIDNYGENADKFKQIFSAIEFLPGHTVMINSFCFNLKLG